MTNAIEAEDLEKTFGGTVRALDGVSFAVEEGTVFGLLGPNGAGKTTAVRILTTILSPDAGVARVLGHDVVAEAGRVRSLIGLAGQYAAVDENLTGRENLFMVGRLNHLARDVVRPRATELLEQFGLTDAGDRPLKTYSGGMRRRLDLAAALVARPKVLFLDEPTTGLDPQSRNDLWEMIEGLVDGGTTVLLTTQYLEEADRLASASPWSTTAGSSPRARRPNSKPTSGPPSSTWAWPTPAIAAARRRDRWPRVGTKSPDGVGHVGRDCRWTTDPGRPWRPCACSTARRWRPPTFGSASPASTTSFWPSPGNGPKTTTMPSADGRRRAHAGRRAGVPPTHDDTEVAR